MMNIWLSAGKAVTWVRSGGKILIQHAILATLPST